MHLRLCLRSQQFLLAALSVITVMALPAHAYIIRTKILQHAHFSSYKDFYLINQGVSPRLLRLVAHDYETLSYKRVSNPDEAQFFIRVSVRQKIIRMRVPVPYPTYGYGYGYGPFWGPGWGPFPFCCVYGPAWGWGVYGYPAYGPAYRWIRRRVRIIAITAVSRRDNTPVWRGTAITRIRNRTALWAIVWRLVNTFPIL